MRKLIVYYNDKTFSSRGERFATRVLDTQQEAERMCDALESLGGCDFEILPAPVRKTA